MSNYTSNDTILDYIYNLDIPDGIHSMTLSNSEIIDFEIINYISDTVFTSSPILGDDVKDTKMLILKFHKDLTINSGVVITPQVRKKGMCILVNGTLTNNGTISMTARGANAVGQDVLLYKNYENNFEYIPKAGANGGVSVYGNSLSGVNGDDGVGRCTGGGGSGGTGTYNNTSGKGTAGTSFSGGSAGGGAGGSAGTIAGTYPSAGSPGAGNPAGAISSYGCSGSTRYRWYWWIINNIFKILY